MKSQCKNFKFNFFINLIKFLSSIKRLLRCKLYELSFCAMFFLSRVKNAVCLEIIFIAHLELVGYSRSLSLSLPVHVNNILKWLKTCLICRIKRIT